MTYYYAGLSYSPNDLVHHGIKGQKWGVRRYQNIDGTLTVEGKKRYSKYGSFDYDHKKFLKLAQASGDRTFGDKSSKKVKEINSEIYKLYDKNSELVNKARKPYDDALEELVAKSDKDFKNSEEFDKEFERLYNEQHKAAVKVFNSREYEETGKEIDRLYDKLAGQVLSDIGYNDTARGRKEVRRLLFLKWY